LHPRQNVGRFGRLYLAWGADPHLELLSKRESCGLEAPEQTLDGRVVFFRSLSVSLCSAQTVPTDGGLCHGADEH
jgi:hypothetical protein